MSLKAIIGGVEYPASKLTECRTYGAFFDSEFTIGAAVSRQIDITISNPGEVARGAEIKLEQDGKPQGTFYIGTRPTNDADVLSIHGYDAMLKTNTAWLNDDYDNVVFPVSEDDALNDICQRIGVERATGVVLWNNFTVDYPVGEFGDLTMQEVLCAIAGANAGCFFINLQGQMDLWRPKEVRNSYDIGRVMTGFESAPASKPITMVYIEGGGGGAYRSGSYSGKSVNFYCPWGSHEMAESVRAALEGYVYQSFTSTDAICDITADIGDTITANGVTSVIISRDVNYYGLNLMQLSAPETDELEDEYPYVDPTQRIEERDLAITNARITRTAEEIRLEISGVEEKVTDISGTLDGLSEDLSKFTDTITGSLDQLQAQIDGQIQTWFDNYIPTSNNAPASTWQTEEEKINHLGDIFYIVDHDTMGGQAYRWANVSGVYQWVLIEDVEVAKALADAAKAQDTADGKRRVFVATPTPPYDVGDLWAQGASGDLMRCNVARASGSYVASDWGKASDYTNDDALQDFVGGEYETTKQEITQRVSSLEVQSDAISATVESHTTQITQVNEKVDGIEVGGRNLLKDSNGVYLSGSDVPSATKREQGKITVLEAGGWNTYEYQGGRLSVPIGELIAEVNTPISFGVDIKTTGLTEVGLLVSFSIRRSSPFLNTYKNVEIDPLLDGKWHRISATILSNSSNYNLCLVGIITSSSEKDFTGVTIEYKNWKLELGNTPTDWTPAPEDVQSDIHDLQDTADNQGLILTSQESRISNLEVNTNAISATVERVETNTKTSLDGVTETLNQLSEKVSLAITSDQVSIAVEKKLAEGVDTVRTKTGYTFDENGMTVSKSGSLMTTQVTENGMYVRRGTEDMLVANDSGVEAKNLNASTFLIIGGKARFEKYGTDRIGCFWIGG